MTYLFKERLGQIMGDRKVSQEKLADAIGAKRQTVASWLYGRTDPDADLLFNVAEFFNVSADYLLGLSDIPATDPDIKAAAEITGLTGDAIATLNTLKMMHIDNIADILNINMEYIRKLIAHYLQQSEVAAEGGILGKQEIINLMCLIYYNSPLAIMLEYYSKVDVDKTTDDNKLLTLSGNNNNIPISVNEEYLYKTALKDYLAAQIEAMKNNEIMPEE